MAVLGRTVLENDEISVPQLSSLFALWLQENLSKNKDTAGQQAFINDKFMPLLSNLIRSVHKAPEGGAHVVCHEESKQEEEKKHEEERDDVEVINLHEECIKQQAELESKIIDIKYQNESLEF